MHMVPVITRIIIEIYAQTRQKVKLFTANNALDQMNDQKLQACTLYVLCPCVLSLLGGK